MKTSHNSDPALTALKAFGVLGTVALIGAGVNTAVNPAKEPTTKYTSTAIPGDTLSSIAADMINNQSGGKIKLSVEELEAYMHTEANPDFPGVDPTDEVLQDHEVVVAEVPDDKIK